MEYYRLLAAETHTTVTIVEPQVVHQESLANVDDFADLLADQVDQLDVELVGAECNDFAAQIELGGQYVAAVVLELVVHRHLGDHVYLEYAQIGVFC